MKKKCPLLRSVKWDLLGQYVTVIASTQLGKLDWTSGAWGENGDF